MALLDIKHDGARTQEPKRPDCSASRDPSAGSAPLMGQHPISDSGGICIFNKYQVMQILLVWGHWVETQGKRQSLEELAGIIFISQHVKVLSGEETHTDRVSKESQTSTV